MSSRNRGTSQAVNTVQSAAVAALARQAASGVAAYASGTGGAFFSNPVTAIVAVVIIALTAIFQSKQRTKAKIRAEEAASFTVALTGDGSGEPIPHVFGRFRTRAIPVLSLIHI